MAPATTKTSTPKAKPAANAGVKKAGRPKGQSRKGKASAAMVLMQAYCK